MHVRATERALAGSLSVAKNVLRKLFDDHFHKHNYYFFLSSHMSFISLHLQNDHQSVNDRTACAPLALRDPLEGKRDAEIL